MKRFHFSDEQSVPIWFLKYLPGLLLLDYLLRLGEIKFGFDLYQREFFHLLWFEELKFYIYTLLLGIPLDTTN